MTSFKTSNTKPKKRSKQIFLSRYGNELSRLKIFSLCLLPLLSLFSLFTGQYYVHRFLLGPSFPMLDSALILALSIFLVLLIELIKYFLTPLFSKSLFYKAYSLAIPALIAALFFAGVSIYFSVNGLQSFFSDTDKKVESLRGMYQLERSKMAVEYDSVLAIKNTELLKLKDELSLSPELIRKQEKYLTQINRLTSQKARAVSRAANKDSVAALFDIRIARADQSLQMLKLSAAGSELNLKASERLDTEIKTLTSNHQSEKEKLQENFELEKAALIGANLSISKNLYGFSFAVEILLIICLGYIQLYKLQFQEKKLPKAKKKSVRLVNKKKPSPPVPTKVDDSKNTAPSRRLSPSEKAEVKKKLKKGVKPEKLAEDYNTSARTIYRIRKQA